MTLSKKSSIAILFLFTAAIAAFGFSRHSPWLQTYSDLAMLRAAADFHDERLGGYEVSAAQRARDILR